MSGAGSDIVNGDYAPVPEVGDDEANVGGLAISVKDAIVSEYLKVNVDGTPFLNSKGGSVQITYSGQYGTEQDTGFWIIAYPPFQHTDKSHERKVRSASYALILENVSHG